MDLLDAALTLTRKIPETDEYRDEHEFCWLIVGRTSLQLGRTGATSECLTALGERRSGCELRLQIIHGASPLRADVLRDFFYRLDFREDLCWRRELSNLAQVFAREYGPAEASTAARRFTDPFTRVCYLTDVADVTRDPVLRRGLLMEAWRDAGEVIGDHDYALKHVVGSYINAEMFDEAGQAVGEMKDPSIRLDYLRWLADARESAGQHHEADSLVAERSELQAANPNATPQSEVLGQAEYLASADPPWGPPSNATAATQIEAMVAAGSHQQAFEELKARFPTRACSVVTALPHDLGHDLLRFQLASVQSYRRNDLKVEFLAELALVLARAGQAEPPEFLRLASSPDYLRLEVAAVPSILARDPSEMTVEQFARFLFDRPLANGEEEQRFMQREVPGRPDISDPAAFVSLTADLFEQFGEIAFHYSLGQVDQGIWHLFGHPFNLRDLWHHKRVPSEVAVRSITACYRVFADYVALNDLPESVTGFHMLWDDYWMSVIPERLESVLETLARILQLEDRDCRYAALHGLNHLHEHIPGAAVAVQDFLDGHGADLDDELRQYAEACRDGDAM